MFYFLIVVYVFMFNYFLKKCFILFCECDFLLLRFIPFITESAMVNGYIFDNLHNIYNMCFIRLFVKLVAWHDELFVRRNARQSYTQGAVAVPSCKTFRLLYLAAG